MRNIAGKKYSRQIKFLWYCRFWIFKGYFFSISDVRISIYFKVKFSIVRDIILNFTEYHFFFFDIYSYSYFCDKFFTGGCALRMSNEVCRDRKWNQFYAIWFAIGNWKSCFSKVSSMIFEEDIVLFLQRYFFPRSIC